MVPGSDGVIYRFSFGLKIETSTVYISKILSKG